MQIVLFSSISESSFEKIKKNFMLKMFQIDNKIENNFINKQYFIHQQRTYKVMKNFFFINYNFVIFFLRFAAMTTFFGLITSSNFMNF